MTAEGSAAYLPTPIEGEMETTFSVNVHDWDALRAYMAQYPDLWTDEKQIIKAMIWQSRNYGDRRDVSGTDGFADLPEGIVSVEWWDNALNIFHDGEWW